MDCDKAFDMLGLHESQKRLRIRVKPMRLLSIAVAFLLFSIPFAASAAPPRERGPCSGTALAAAGTAVARARLALAALPVKEMDTNITPQAHDAIERLKDRIQQAVRLTMSCAPGSAAPKALKAMLAANGGAHAAPATWTRDMHGRSVDYAVEAVAGRPGWVAILPTIGIECGSDTMLMLFASGGQGWREIISRRSTPLGTVADGWEGLQYAVSPRDAAGRWYLAVSRTTPWCTSAWRGLRYNFSHASSNPARPDIFFHHETGIYIGADDAGTLHAAANNFEIRHDGWSIDAAVLVRKHIEHYAIRGDHVRRTQPVALNPRDFIDEWIVSPWAEAASWSAPGGGLEKAHAGLYAGRHDPNSHVSLSFGAIRQCGNVAQIEIDPDKGAPWYFLVSGKTFFTVSAVSRRPSRSCR